MKNDGHKALARLKYPDPYTLLEFEWTYKNLEDSKKLEYLESVKMEVETIPEEIAKILIKINDKIGKFWLAKNIEDFDIFDQNEGSVYKKLLSDSDAYIKATILENSGFMGPIVKTLNEADSLSRLALIRHKEVGSDLTEKLFDFNDKELKISLQERENLIKAWLTNSDEIKESHRDFLDHVDVLDAGFSGLKYNKIWELISAWPEEHTELKGLVYRYVGKGKKSEIYQKENDNLKYQILLGCNSEEYSDNELLKSALNEKVDYLRSLAFRLCSDIPKELLKKTLISEDNEALEGIAFNKNISVNIRRTAINRLRELGKRDPAVYWARKEIEKEEASGEIDYEAISSEDILSQEEKTKNKKDSNYRYLWPVVSNLIALAVVFGIFSSSSNPSETRLISILILVYLNLQYFSSQYGATTARLAIGLEEEFKKVRNLLKDKPSEFEVEQMKENREAIQKALDQMNVNNMFIALAYIVALWNLFTSL